MVYVCNTFLITVYWFWSLQLFANISNVSLSPPPTSCRCIFGFIFQLYQFLWTLSVRDTRFVLQINLSSVWTNAYLVRTIFKSRCSSANFILVKSSEFSVFSHPAITASNILPYIAALVFRIKGCRASCRYKKLQFSSHSPCFSLQFLFLCVRQIFKNKINCWAWLENHKN